MLTKVMLELERVFKERYFSFYEVKTLDFHKVELPRSHEAAADHDCAVESESDTDTLRLLVVTRCRSIFVFI